MKKKMFLFAAAMLSVLGVSAQWVRPGIKTQDPAKLAHDGTLVRIYNVEQGGFLGGGNSWGTQTSLLEEGLDYKLELSDDGKNYKLLTSSGSRPGKYTFRDNVSQCYVDKGSQNFGFNWTITVTDKGFYTIQSPLDDAVYGTESYDDAADMFFGWNGDKNIVYADVRVGDKDEDGNLKPCGIEWAFLTVEDAIALSEAPKPHNVANVVDGEPYTNTRRITYDAVTFSKTFASGAVNKWNALYVPISIDAAAADGEYDIAEIYAFCATVDTNGDGTVDANDERFLFVRPLTSGRTYPNTPYLIRPREAKTYTISSADNILYEKRDGKVEFSTTRDKFVVTGLNESFTVVAGDNNYYVTGTGGLSFRTSGSTTVKPNRWVMHREDREYSDIPDYVEDTNHLENEDNGESGVKEFRIITIGEDMNEADAIMAVKKANGIFTSGIYTLDGRKVSDGKSLPTGVYIKDGKKYVVK